MRGYLLALDIPESSDPASLILLPRWRLPDSGGDLVAHVPEIFIKPTLHALLQNLYRRPHGTNDPPSDDPLGQLQMMEAKQLHAFVKVEKALGNIMQAKKIFVLAIELSHRQPRVLNLLMKNLAEARSNVQQ